MSGKKQLIFLVLVLLIIFSSDFLLAKSDVTELKHYPISSAEDVIIQTFDKTVSSDQNGSLKITAAKPVTIKLFETGDIDVEDARITFSAKVKTQDLTGKVYLEMWCNFKGRGEFFSRGLHSVVTGTADWSAMKTPFFLNKGENPDNIKLNLVIEGKGVVWIDDIHLYKGPLK